MSFLFMSVFLLDASPLLAIQNPWNCMYVDSSNMPVPSSCVVGYVILHVTIELRYIHHMLMATCYEDAVE